MSELKTVFIVTSGEYSDYGISSVWTTQEAAEREAGTWGRVEEWVLNERLLAGRVEWRAFINTHTQEIVVGDQAVETQEIGHTEVQQLANGKWTGRGYGVSPEHARKSLSDALAKAKAEAEGI